MKKFILKLSAIIPALAIGVGIMAAKSPCLAFFHQLETPDEMNAYRR